MPRYDKDKIKFEKLNEFLKSQKIGKDFTTRDIHKFTGYSLTTCKKKLKNLYDSGKLCRNDDRKSTKHYTYYVPVSNSQFSSNINELSGDIEHLEEISIKEKISWHMENGANQKEIKRLNKILEFQKMKKD